MSDARSALHGAPGVIGGTRNTASDTIASLADKGQDTEPIAQSSLAASQLAPGVPGKPYVISTQDGETIYIPLSKSATRLLVTGKETDDAFAIVSSGGSQGDPIGFHYHREAHDVFLCLQGEVNVWADDRCRTLSAGDFASVPPGTIHQYQILGAHSSMAGLIVPGGWEEFFRVIGEPYDGPMWPMQDDRNFFQVLLPRLKAAAETLDMVPCPTHKGVEPQPWLESDTELSGGLQPYFLKNATGPAWIVGGTVCRPLATVAESGGRFSISRIEASKKLKVGLFETSNRRLTFTNLHHAFLVVEGKVEFSIGASQTTCLSAGELVFVPKQTAFAFKAWSRHASFYAFANGGGLTEVYQCLGVSHPLPILPERAAAWEESKLGVLGAKHGFRYS